jgi:glutamine synthetase
MNKKEILKRVDKERVEFIRVEHLDYNGIIRSRSIRRRRLKDALDTGINMSMAIMSFNIFEKLINNPLYGSNAGDYFLLPDPDTFMVVPYLNNTARMFCDLVDEKGKPWQGCPRNALQKMLKEVEEMGFQLKMACETEGSLVRKEGSEYIPADFSKCFTTDGLDIQDELLQEVVFCLEKMGILIDKMTAEYAPGQYEVNLAPANPLKAAEDLITYKEIWRALARKKGLIATFMPKPFKEYAGNGLHVHMSLYDSKGETNLFADKNDLQGIGLSSLAYFFIGGLLKHAAALTAIGAPTINSYKRLLPGHWCPAHICYGQGNRDVLVRIPDGRRTKRLEFRSPDAACNPYLAIAAIIAAGIDGIKKEIDPGQPVREAIGSLSREEIEERGIKWLPSSLVEAIHALQEDNYIQEKLGPVLMKEFIRVRQSEFDTFREEVSEKEREIYLETY